MSAIAQADPISGLWSETLDRQTPPVPWLWDGYLAAGKVTLLTSQWKSGKTTLISILLSKLAAGGKLADLTLKPGRAIVISEESFADWSLRHQRLHFQNTYFVCRPFRSKPTLEQWLGLLQHISRVQRDYAMNLLVLDTLATFLPGQNESSAGPMMQALLPLIDLQERDMGILLSHHPRKGESAAGQAARGSGALAGFVDIVMEMDWSVHPAEDDRRRKILAFSRQDLTPRQRVIELNQAGTDYIVHGSFQDDEFLQHWAHVKMVLEEAKWWRTRRQILEDWPPDFPKPADITLGRWLDRAAGLNQVMQKGTGKKNDPFRYALPGQEDIWKKDPRYALCQKIEDSNRLIKEKFGVDLPPPPGRE
jgi:hypothetical protein